MEAPRLVGGTGFRGIALPPLTTAATHQKCDVFETWTPIVVFLVRETKLVHIGNGVWTGTWKPVNASTGTVSVAESNRDLQALIGAAESLGGPGFLVPTRNASLFPWCLENGLRVVQPNTLMSMGLYNEPSRAWIRAPGGTPIKRIAIYLLLCCLVFYSQAKLVKAASYPILPL